MTKQGLSTDSITASQWAADLEEQGRYKEAIAMWLDAAKHDISHHLPYWKVGFLYLRLNSSDRCYAHEAKAFFRESLYLKDDCLQAWIGLGEAYIILEDYRSAINALAKARQIKDLAVVCSLISYCYIYMEDYDEAIRELHRATLKDVRFDEAYYNLGLCYLKRNKLGDKTLARAAYDQFMMLNRDYWGHIILNRALRTNEECWWAYTDGALVKYPDKKSLDPEEELSNQLSAMLDRYGVGTNLRILIDVLATRDSEEPIRSLKCDIHKALQCFEKKKDQQISS